MWRWITVGIASIAAAAAGAYYWFKDSDGDEGQTPDPSVLSPSTSKFARPTINQEDYQHGQKSCVSKQQHLKPNTTRSAFNRLLKQPPATKQHLWLLSIKQDEVVSVQRIENDSGLTPTLGWPMDDSTVLAGFISPDKLKRRKNGMRILVGPGDSNGAQLAAITRQAVPIFLSADEGWRFAGFFRFSRPAGQSVGCSQLSEPPPELLRLMPGSVEASSDERSA